MQFNQKLDNYTFYIYPFGQWAVDIGMEIQIEMEMMEFFAFVVFNVQIIRNTLYNG